MPKLTLCFRQPGLARRVAGSTADDLNNLVDPDGSYDLSVFDDSLLGEIRGLNVKELQEHIKDLGVSPVTGNKHELQWRLAKAITLSEAKESG